MYDDEDSMEDVEYEPVSQSDYAHTEDNGQPQNMNEEDNNAFALDSQQYKRYKSFPVLQELHGLGLPLWFVIADVNNKSFIRFVMGNGKTGTLHCVLGDVGWTSPISGACLCLMPDMGAPMNVLMYIIIVLCTVS
jgi:hypothetical protein